MKVHHVFFALVLCAAGAYATIVQVKGERKIADAAYIQRQKQILRLYLGSKQNEYFTNEYTDFNLKENANQWSDPGIVKSFLELYEDDYSLPQNGIFTLYEPKIWLFTKSLFDVFYFAKDFDTLYKVASWAKKHVEPVLFNYAFTMAIYHREDCQQHTVPAMYEMVPDYFVPQETLRQVYHAKLMGIKEAVFDYNNTGYEYNYNPDSFGGVLGYDISNDHLEHKLSYFREDIGLNNFYLAWQRRYTVWLTDKKYGKSHWFRRGEGFYYTHQQLLARYTLERLSNGLPFVDLLQWDKPVKVGYNPKVSHLGGQPFFARPDNVIPTESANWRFIKEARRFEHRAKEAIAYHGVWDVNNDTLLSFGNNDGTDVVGKLIYGAWDSPNRKFYGSYFYKGLQALSNIPSFKNNDERNSGVISCPYAALRDPLFFNFIAEIIEMIQTHKAGIPLYSKKELEFPGVQVKNLEFDKLVTYFENYKFDVSNAVPVRNNSEYKEFKYWARQYRLNHQPYTYKITLDSDASYDGIVRLFIGPKYDAQERELTIDQRRLAMVEIDRFPVKINAGNSILERSSKQSPIFTSDEESIRQTYDRINKTLKNSEPYYYSNEKVTCGIPDRFQLPKGLKNGQPFVFTVVVSPFTKEYEGETKEFYTTCGSSKLYDYRALGFPFDRKIKESHFKVPNIFTKDFLIYNKDGVIGR